MRTGERLRVRFVFGLLGAVPVFLCGWLAWLQVAHRGELQRESGATVRLVATNADAQARRAEVVPAPRGTIVDRHGAVLAVDRPTYDVRAAITVPHKHRKRARAMLGWLGKTAGDLATALACDPDLADRAVARRVHLEAVSARLAAAFRTQGLAPGDDPQQPPPAQQRFAADVLLASGVDVLPVVAALRALDEGNDFVALHFLRTHRRAYPDRDLTHGYVGHVETIAVERGGARSVETAGVCGLETFAALQPEAAVVRSFLQDGDGRPYFLAPAVANVPPDAVHASLDLELQRCAMRALEEQAEEPAREGKQRPLWGALVLVEIATGDVLAAASWHRDRAEQKGLAWTPYQSLYEPGSIVKPLVFAHALELGALDWNHTYDCDPGSAEYRERIAARGRRKGVSDDHPCGLLTPHGILVNSSNIGATYVGLGLDRDQWAAYMRRWGFGGPLGLRLPHGARSRMPKQSFAPSTPLRSFYANSAISFSFGYELQVTAMHVARAYLRLFRGSASELRVCRGVEVDGRFHAAPLPPAGERLSREAIDRVRLAMIDVVSSDPHATGSHLHARVLRDEGLDLHGIVGGKTGTAASMVGVPGRGKVEMRNASFIGFLPVEEPRWLAVCVLQRDDSARFYGGSYAAPPVVRLLLQAQRLEQRRLLRQEPRASDGQVRNILESPGDSGWSRGAPETTLAGR